jgi:pyruvate-ferredoxin/flavodoxin oxidoreductase
MSSQADLQQRMQGIVLLGVFLRVTPFQAQAGISQEQLFAGVEKALRKYFGKRGERVVQDNLRCVERGYRELIEIPREMMMSTAAADDANAALRVM